MHNALPVISLLLFGLAWLLAYANFVASWHAMRARAKDPDAPGFSMVPVLTGAFALGAWYLDRGLLGRIALVPLLFEPLVFSAPILLWMGLRNEWRRMRGGQDE